MRTGKRTSFGRLLALALVLAIVVPLIAMRWVAFLDERTVSVWLAFAEGSKEETAVKDLLAEIVRARPRLSVKVTALGDQCGSALAEASTRGTLPDLVFAPAEWASALSDLGLIRPPEAAVSEDCFDGVRAALQVGGAWLGLPAFTSSIALGRRVPPGATGPAAWPATLDALLRQVQDAAAGEKTGLYWPYDDLFYAAPWLLGAGGYLEPPRVADSAVETTPPAVAEHAVLAWFEALDRIRAVASMDLGDEDLAQRWQTGTPFYAALTSDDMELLREQGLEAEVGPIPGGRSFLTTWAWFLAQRGLDPKPQTVSLIARLASLPAVAATDFALRCGFLPVTRSGFAVPAVAEAGLTGFHPVLESGEALPSGEHAAELWMEYQSALGDYLAGAKASEVLERLLNEVSALLGEPES